MFQRTLGRAADSQTLTFEAVCIELDCIFNILASPWQTGDVPVFFFRVFPAHHFSPQETTGGSTRFHPPALKEGTQQRSEELGQRHGCGGLEDLRGDDAQRVEYAEGWDGMTRI